MCNDERWGKKVKNVWWNMGKVHWNSLLKLKVKEDFVYDKVSGKTHRLLQFSFSWKYYLGTILSI